MLSPLTLPKMYSTANKPNRFTISQMKNIFICTNGGLYLFQQGQLGHVEKSNSFYRVTIKVPVFPMIHFALAGVTECTKLGPEAFTHLAAITQIIQHVVHSATNRLWITKVTKMLCNHILLAYIDLLYPCIQDGLHLIRE